MFLTGIRSKKFKKAVEKEPWTLKLVPDQYKAKRCNKEVLKDILKHLIVFLISIKPKGNVKELLREGHMHWNFFLISIGPKICMEHLFKEIPLHCLMFLISIRPRRYVKEL